METKHNKRYYKLMKTKTNSKLNCIQYIFNLDKQKYKGSCNGKSCCENYIIDQFENYKYLKTKPSIVCDCGRTKKQNII